MLTVLESIKLTTEYLQNKGIESPRINAELMLAKILNCKRLDLYLMFDRPLKQDEIEMFREFMKRRSTNEPLQYILGSVEFYGLEFIVNKNVLIPRPETEILVETIINNSNKEEQLKILDIGTGSGNIAVALAKNLPESHVISIDISTEALETACENAKLNKVDERISFQLKNIFNDFDIETKFYDIIVSNPPYVSSEQYQELQPELKVYEPGIALTDNSDGLSFYKIISSKATNILKENGKIYYEVGADQYKIVIDILEGNKFKNIKVVKDYQNIERVIFGEL